jgi:hypothetical protein
MKINHAKEPNEVHKNNLKEILQVINENFIQMILDMVNQNAKDYSHTDARGLQNTK